MMLYRYTALIVVVEPVDHSRRDPPTKVRRAQTSGFVKRFNRMALNEFSREAF